MERKPQTYANHGKFDPWFHFILSPLMLLLFVTAVRRAFAIGTWDAWWRVALVIAIFIIGSLCRIYALKAQDRIIRLEETLRAQRLLSPELMQRFGELTVSQIVALRFASDAEFGDVVEKALAAKLSNQAIKQGIRVWRPDYHRI